jgi:hypothetical protein
VRNWIPISQRFHPWYSEGSRTQPGFPVQKTGKLPSTNIPSPSSNWVQHPNNHGLTTGYSVFHMWTHNLCLLGQCLVLIAIKASRILNPIHPPGTEFLLVSVLCVFPNVNKIIKTILLYISEPLVCGQSMRKGFWSNFKCVLFSKFVKYVSSSCNSCCLQSSTLQVEAEFVQAEAIALLKTWLTMFIFWFPE